MTKNEAKALAKKLGVTVNSVKEFWRYCQDNGLEIGLDNKTGNWVVLKAGAVVAECE